MKARKARPSVLIGCVSPNWTHKVTEGEGRETGANSCWRAVTGTRHAMPDANL